MSARGSPAAGDPAADAEVVAASLGSPARFGEIYDAYFEAIHGYLAGRLGPDMAHDLAAEVFLTAFRVRRSFDPARGAVRPWLFGIASNLAARHRRAEALQYRLLAEAAAGRAVDGPGDLEADRVVERLSAQSLRQPLIAAVARLPARERDVLLLVALGGLSYEDAAAALSIAPGTVGSRLSRAKVRLRAALGGNEPSSQRPGGS